VDFFSDPTDFLGSTEDLGDQVLTGDRPVCAECSQPRRWQGCAPCAARAYMALIPDYSFDDFDALPRARRAA
jgi:hypothetical protein